eukprot:2996495-Pleurochrysis_carterae.AAC.1
MRMLISIVGTGRTHRPQGLISASGCRMVPQLRTEKSLKCAARAVSPPRPMDQHQAGAKLWSYARPLCGSTALRQPLGRGGSGVFREAAPSLRWPEGAGDDDEAAAAGGSEGDGDISALCADSSFRFESVDSSDSSELRADRSRSCIGGGGDGRARASVLGSALLSEAVE